MGSRHNDEYSCKVRPSTLQKLVKKYYGSKDLYDHVASFRQVVHVEEVTDTLWLICFGGIGVPVTAFCEIMQFFLKPENVNRMKVVRVPRHQLQAPCIKSF